MNIPLLIIITSILCGIAFSLQVFKYYSYDLFAWMLFQVNFFKKLNIIVTILLQFIRF